MKCRVVDTFFRDSKLCSMDAVVRQHKAYDALVCVCDDEESYSLDWENVLLWGELGPKVLKWKSATEGVNHFRKSLVFSRLTCFVTLLKWHLKEAETSSGKCGDGKYKCVIFHILSRWSIVRLYYCNKKMDYTLALRQITWQLKLMICRMRLRRI